MRRWYAVGAAVVVLLAAINGIWSRSPEKAGRNTRTGLVNMAYILKSWSKPNQLNKEMQEFYKPMQEKAERLEEQMREVQKELREPSLPQEKRDPLQKRLQQLTEAIQQNSKSAREALQEKNNKNMVAISAALETATRRYAEVHDLDVVMCYADAFTAEDRQNPVRVELKLKSAACWPIFAAAGVDISKEIVALLESEGKATPAGE
jgi:Skp family chaperone for outer membrane proteins